MNEEVQKLISKLNYIAKCVRPGMIFISPMLEFLRSFSKVGAQPLSIEIRKDEEWWVRFLPVNNGVSMMSLEEWLAPDEILASDACLVGGGRWGNGQFFQYTFPEFIQEQNIHIDALEMLTVILYVQLWGNQWKGKRIVISCDNLVSVQVINTNTARDKFLLQCLRELTFLAVMDDFDIRATQISGISNKVPDILSRWDLDSTCRNEFNKITYNVHKVECKVGANLFHFYMIGNLLICR